MMLADALAGRTIRCSKCGGDVFVPAGSTTAAPDAKAKKKAAASAATPSLEISPAIIISAIVGVVVLAIVLVLYFGPWTVGKKWEAMSATANTQVTDVVTFAIQAYESEHHLYDASQSHMAPHADGDATFVPPMMAFSMPQRIIFSGRTNQGKYIGTWNTSTGEIIADIETGGYSVGGLVDVKKATGQFHITGRIKDGQPQAESDGEPLKIVMAPPHRRGEE
jgi:hypothetical protein